MVSDKYFVILCTEDLEPGVGDVVDSSSSSSSSSSESNKENSRPSSNNPSPRPSGSTAASKGLSRRQRKNNRRREETTTTTNSPRKNRRNNLQTVMAPLKHWAKLGLSEPAVHKLLGSYVLSREQLLTMGYPIESEQHKGKVVIFKSAPVHLQSKHKFDVNAREFVPRNKETDYSLDSGQGSSSSSEVDSEESNDLMNIRASILNEDYEVQTEDPIEGRQHTCVRCRSSFYIKNENEYSAIHGCVYHHGKLQSGWGHETIYSCCGGYRTSVGCCQNKYHVWSGVVTGFNGPYEFVRTKYRKHPPAFGNFGVYAMDCEMVYTIAGMELARVTVVGIDGRLVYDAYVRPDNEILDYNTRYSGITVRDMKNSSKTLKDVQNDLMGFINADTILIGHSLENDLRALKMVHYSVIDTAVAFPHYNGLPYRRSLKSLVSCFLRREIQNNGDKGHDSIEDSQACMDLMLWRVRKDFIGLIEHYQ